MPVSDSCQCQRANMLCGFCVASVLEAWGGDNGQCQSNVLCGLCVASAPEDYILVPRLMMANV